MDLHVDVRRAQDSRVPGQWGLGQCAGGRLRLSVRCWCLTRPEGSLGSLCTGGRADGEPLTAELNTPAECDSASCPHGVRGSEALGGLDGAPEAQPSHVGQQVTGRRRSLSAASPWGSCGECVTSGTARGVLARTRAASSYLCGFPSYVTLSSHSLGVHSREALACLQGSHHGEAAAQPK